MVDEDVYVLDEAEEAEEEPYWTRRRIIWAILAVLIITALIVSMLAPLIFQVTNPPPPLPTPMLDRI